MRRKQMSKWALSLTAENSQEPITAFPSSTAYAIGRRFVLVIKHGERDVFTMKGDAIEWDGADVLAALQEAFEALNREQTAEPIGRALAASAGLENAIGRATEAIDYARRMTIAPAEPSSRYLAEMAVLAVLGG